jgi:mono/diheme cytochrome c family protein
MNTRVAGGVIVLAAALPLLVFSQSSNLRGGRQRLTLPVGGAEIFRAYCATCHGTDGKGHGPAAASLRHGPPDLTLLSRQNGGKFPRERVKAIVEGREQSVTAHGSREMPVWGPVFHTVESDQDFGEVRLDNVTRFVESLQQK